MKGLGKFGFLLPSFGVTLGCVTVALTLAIMEGMEYSIMEVAKILIREGQDMDQISKICTVTSAVSH